MNTARNIEAVKKFHQITGETCHDEEDFADAANDIGNPNANLPLTQTSETVEDFVASGWAMDKEQVEGVTTLKKGFSWAHIIDCDDYRLVYVERN